VNVLGQEIVSMRDVEKQQGWYQRSIDMGSLPTGTYFVLVGINDKKQIFITVHI
jgi:hypothetical protein